MNQSGELTENLHRILAKYQTSFSEKVYKEENDESDLLMDLFALTPELKRENRQYWGRELGMCWQLLVTEVCRQRRADFAPALRFGADEPCDFVVELYAIDTKYRIGSGDSGTLKKFRAYGEMLRKRGYKPALLILRDDNLPAALNACEKGGWRIFTGENCFQFIEDLTGFDLKTYLSQKAGDYTVLRD